MQLRNFCVNFSKMYLSPNSPPKNVFSNFSIFSGNLLRTETVIFEESWKKQREDDLYFPQLFRQKVPGLRTLSDSLPHNVALKRQTGFPHFPRFFVAFVSICYRKSTAERFKATFVGKRASYFARY